MRVISRAARSMRWISASAVIAGLLLASPRADALEAGAQFSYPITHGNVEPFYGMFAWDIPIHVPAYHGLEPKISLGYSSSTRRNGPVGVGWSLNGWSMIERASPGKGAPRYNTSDVYLLDGDLLVASTALGGTHATKTQGYLRITQSGSSWFTWAKNGTKSTYSPIYTVGGNTFRWGLTNVTDTNGNTVTYTWTCTGGDCYPATVSYNTTTITASWSSRTDTITFATGGTTQGTTAFRLNDIQITTGGALVRKYVAAYTTMASTQQLVLSTVKELGTDGTTAQPTITATWPAEPTGAFSASTFTTMANPSGELLIGDANGDGKADLFEHWAGQDVWVQLSNGNGTFGAATHTVMANASGELLLGDVNGDGKDDLIEHWAGFQVWAHLSNGNGTFQTGIFTAMANPSGELFMADVNGDGKADLVEHWAGKDVWIHLSNGNGTFQTGVHTVLANSSGEIFLADVNGDGKADVVQHWNGFQVWVHLSNGNGTFQTGIFTALANPSGEVLMADIDGDGMADAVEHWNGFQIWVHRSLGNGSFSTGVFTALANPSGEIRMADVNGDGKADVLQHWAGKDVWCHLSKGNATFSAGVHTVMTNASGELFMGDFDGDGKSDAIEHWNGSQVWAHPVAGSAAAFAVASISNGLGSTTTPTYASSTAWPNTNNPPQAQTVASLATTDGRGNTSTTTYSYSGGLWDPIDRRFLGFRYAKRTLPCITGESTCPYQETWFKQDYGSVSKPERIDLRTGAGKLQISEQFEYTTNGATVPYTSLETGVWKYQYEPTGVTSKRTYISRMCGATPCFDTFGNVTREISYGFYDTTGDEKTVTFTYAPNATAYVVGRLATQSTFDGVGTAGALIADQRYFYDGNASYATAPTKGNLTQQARWLDTNNSYVATRSDYDAFGNVTVSYDETSNATTTAYDATLHVFPTSVTNAKGQVTTSVWNTLCSVMSSSTDSNAQVTTYTYDKLCRLTRKDTPLAGFEIWTYNSFGTAGSQNIKVERPAADASGNLYEQTYFDGVGRTWRTVAKGPGTSSIFQDIAYDNRGNVYTKTLPYYTSGTQYKTTINYDALDRPTKETYADAKLTSKVYGVFTVTATDPIGHQTADDYDAYGNIALHKELLSGTWYSTTYAIDVRGFPTKTTDALGNVTTYAYDSLGRKTQMAEPNLGLRSYGYDAAGRLSTQIDALSQQTTMAYDVLGRPTQKVSRAGTGNAVTFSWTYDEPRTGYYNVGRRTTSTDPSGSMARNYDAAGREVDATRVISGQSYHFQRRYNTGGLLLGTTYPDGDVVGSTASPLVYDGAGRLSTIPGIVDTTTYDAAGHVLTHANANATSTTYAYLAQRGWLTGITTTGASTLQNLAYTRDAEGKITALTSPFADEGWTYAYDDRHRLTSATSANTSLTQSYQYNAIGNITYSSRLGTYTYPASGPNGCGTGVACALPNAATAAGSNTYTYDANGSMTSGAGRSITWDGDLRPSAIDGLTFAYDADGVRLEKAAGATVSYYVGDDYEVAGGVATKFLSLGNVPVAKRVGTTTFWLHTDHLGSIQVVTDAARAEVQRINHHPFGDRISTSTMHVQTTGFTGQRLDETGLYFLHARYFDPTLARFISADAIVPNNQNVGLNRYAYGINDPINNTDVDGHEGKPSEKNRDLAIAGIQGAGVLLFGNPLTRSVINSHNDKFQGRLLQPFDGWITRGGDEKAVQHLSEYALDKRKFSELTKAEQKVVTGVSESMAETIKNSGTIYAHSGAGAAVMAGLEYISENGVNTGNGTVRIRGYEAVITTGEVTRQQAALGGRLDIHNTQEGEKGSQTFDGLIKGKINTLTGGADPPFVTHVYSDQSVYNKGKPDHVKAEWYLLEKGSEPAKVPLDQYKPAPPPPPLDFE
jgi:RHS repeat-associated protein